MHPDPRRRRPPTRPQTISCLLKDQNHKAVLDRQSLSDRQGAIIAPLGPGQQGDHARTGADNRLFPDAILWLAQDACPWRNLPLTLAMGAGRMRGFGAGRLPGFGRGLSRRQARTKPTRPEPDPEYARVDAAICTAQAVAASRKGGLTLPVSTAPEMARQPKSLRRSMRRTCRNDTRSRRAIGAFVRWRGGLSKVFMAFVMSAQTRLISPSICAV